MTLKNKVDLKNEPQLQLGLTRKLLLTPPHTTPSHPNAHNLNNNDYDRNNNMNNNTNNSLVECQMNTKPNMNSHNNNNNNICNENNIKANSKQLCCVLIVISLVFDSLFSNNSKAGCSTN